MSPQTLSIAMGIPMQRAKLWAESLTAAMARFQINTPQRVAACIAQIGHESAGLSRLEEELNYTSPERLCQIWPTRFYLPPDDPELTDVDASGAIAKRVNALHYVGRPIAIGNHVYAGRNGNGDEGSGDGYNFRARGPLGLTWYANYLAFGKAIGRDLVSSPDLVIDPEIGSLSVGWIWQTRGCNDFVDRNDFDGLTRAINGGTIGLADRFARFQTASNAIRNLGPLYGDVA